MTSPFRLLPPTAPVIPLVCDSPHSGVHYPDDFGFAVEHAALRRCEDTHVDTLWSAVPATGGHLLCANYPRSYIDPNRDEEDIDTTMLDDSWFGNARPSARTQQLGMGLVWRATPDRMPIYDRKLSASELRHRVESCWRPYRTALAALVLEAEARQGQVWHLNLHSMPSNVYARLGQSARPAADVVLGDRRGSSCSPTFTEAVAVAFRCQGLSVSINDPYEGADLVRTFGMPDRGRHSLQIELNRALYMNEDTREPHAGFDPLQAAIGQVLGQIAVFVRQHAA